VTALGARDARPYARAVAERGIGAAGTLMLAEVPDGARVLDIGCASGYLAARLVARGCAVTGFEVDPRSAALAEAHCERVIVGDLESPHDRATIPDGFDVVLLGDVLEHLVDPWHALRFVRGLVAPGGVVVVSMPNVAAWTVRLALLRGAWRYTETGLLDRTHLRFFTRRTAHELVRGAGFEIERERFSPIEQAPGMLRQLLPRVTDVAVKSMLRIWPELMAQQFVLRLRPGGPAPLARG
jgi:2-polyprenyl-3-methyl-5-hydroxy-6-metoxy-1,4-benzoquinol methylase